MDIAIERKQTAFRLSCNLIEKLKEAARRENMLPNFKKPMKNVAGRKGANAQVVDPSTLNQPKNDSEPFVKSVRVTPVEK